MSEDHRINFYRDSKRVRVMAGGKAVADALRASLLLETGAMPVYYFPREDVRMDFLEPTNHRTHCPYKGDASYWNLKLGAHAVENAAWSYDQPRDAAKPVAGQIAFEWGKPDHWFEEDEEIFGHPRDPYHRVDVRPSSRPVRVFLNGRIVAQTRRGLFLFETGLPTRYYIPPGDVDMEVLVASRTKTICPYKGTASYWSLRDGDQLIRDAVWSYLEPLPECPRIESHFCFYPEKVTRLEVEGEDAFG